MSENIVKISTKPVTVCLFTGNNVEEVTEFVKEYGTVISHVGEVCILEDGEEYMYDHIDVISVIGNERCVFPGDYIQCIDNAHAVGPDIHVIDAAHFEKYYQIL